MYKSEHAGKALLLNKSAEKSADWLICPRCMKGNMYAEYEDECVCLQCGYRHYTHSSTFGGMIKESPAGLHKLAGTVR
jgi:ribosomal protein S27AE